MTKIKIKITKDILKRSQYCNNYESIQTNCAFALAVRDILPKAAVMKYTIMPFAGNLANHIFHAIKLEKVNEEIKGIQFCITQEMTSFIDRFDNASPEKRETFPEQEFELKIPNWVIDEISQKEVDFVQKIANSSTLELIVL